MYGNLIDSIIKVFMYVAAFYQKMFLQGSSPLVMLQATEEQQSALDFAASISDMAGHDEIANTLRIVVDNMRNDDNMRTFQKVIELLLSPHMDYDQYVQLKAVDEKVDAILQLGKVFPTTIRQIKDVFNKVSDGKLSIDDVETLMHAAIKGYEAAH